jgi:thiamine transporter
MVVDPKNLNQLILAEGTKVETNNTLNSNKPNDIKSFRNRTSKFFEPFQNPKTLAEIAIFIALGTALSFFTFAVFPQGGSVTLGSMVPILWLSLRRGPKVGIFAAFVYGLVQLAVFPQVYYPTQVLLDYPLAFGYLGLAGFFQKRPIIGTIIAVTGRFIMHLISGAIFFASLYAPTGMDYWVYSALYNGSYMLPELIISVFFIGALWKSKVLKVYM